MIPAQALFRKPFGKFDEDAPVAWIFDFPEGDDEPQSFENIQIDLIILEQLQQFVAGKIGIFNVHRRNSLSEWPMARPDNERDIKFGRP